MRSRAAEHDHAQAGVGGTLGGARDERIDHREIERVERVRTIQRQRRDGSLAGSSRTVSFIGMAKGVP